MNMASAIDANNISVGMKFGCLLILDDGSEKQRILDEQIDALLSEKLSFLKAIENGELRRHDLFSSKGNITAYIYDPQCFQSHFDSITVHDFDVALADLLAAKEQKAYQCRCVKCGKIRYYSAKTLLTYPKVCYKPIYCPYVSSHSIKAYNANFDKRERYADNEAVRLVLDKEDLNPNDEYCEVWNKKRSEDLEKQAAKEKVIIAALPRKYAANYDKDFVGTRYESLEILECSNDRLESAPAFSFNQRHKKCYREITVYKEYRCRCYVCGKEQKITCDKFGIFPPTQYGFRADKGYWSAALCDCHNHSSFQWIVNDILIKHHVDYRVEVAFDGLYGIDDKTPLRFDFGIYDNGVLVALVECQGEQHYKPVEKFDGVSGLDKQQRNDAKKRSFVKENNIRLIEISYKVKKYEKVEALLIKENLLNSLL